MTVQTKAYDEIIDFIIKGKPPEEIISFKPSDNTNKRVEYLIYKERDEGLTPPETSELEHYLLIEHLMRLAKARAKKQLKA